jgi:nonsense-mediated mRNA decay protein 3
VLDIEPSGKTNGRWVLADAQVAVNGAFQGGMDLDEGEGSASGIYHTRTHLGGILQPGDTALGYLLSRANFNSDEFDALDAGRVPDVILVKKTYPNRRKKTRTRAWRLRSIAKEANEEVEGGEGRGALGRRGGLDQAKVEADYEAFLQDLEEDPELRATINLYKAEQKEKADAEMAAAATGGKGKKGGKKGGQYSMEGVEAAKPEEEEEEEGGFPEVKLEELMEDLALEDEEPTHE